MATVDKKTADNIKSHNGYYDGDEENKFGDNHRCIEITEYDNSFGGVGYGLTFEGSANIYTPSHYVINPRCYWKYKNEPR